MSKLSISEIILVGLCMILVSWGNAATISVTIPDDALSALYTYYTAQGRMTNDPTQLQQRVTEDLQRLAQTQSDHQVTETLNQTLQRLLTQCRIQGTAACQRLQERLESVQ